MEEILDRQDAKVRRGELAVEEDSEFHYSIALACNNSAVLKVVDELMELLRDARRRLVSGKRPAGEIACRSSSNSVRH